MISKSKLGAIAFMAVIGLASPAFAQYGSPSTGGGSAGYNRGVSQDYRLKKHHPVTGKKLHNQVKPAAKSAKPKS